MLAQFRVVFTHFHLALSIFRLCILCLCVKVSRFRVMHFDHNFCSFLFISHFYYLYCSCRYSKARFPKNQVILKGILVNRKIDNFINLVEACHPKRRSCYCVRLLRLRFTPARYGATLIFVFLTSHYAKATWDKSFGQKWWLSFIDYYRTHKAEIKDFFRVYGVPILNHVK